MYQTNYYQFDLCFFKGTFCIVYTNCLNMVFEDASHERRSEIWQSFWLDKKEFKSRCEICFKKDISTIYYQLLIEFDLSFWLHFCSSMFLWPCNGMATLFYALVPFEKVGSNRHTQNEQIHHEYFCNILNFKEKSFQNLLILI